jgi:hypothetical protein
MGEPVQLNLQGQHSIFPSFTSNAKEAIFKLLGNGLCEAKICRRRAVRAVPELSVFVGIPTFIGYKSCSYACDQALKNSDTLVVFWPCCKNFCLFLFVKIFMENPELESNMMRWEKTDAAAAEFVIIRIIRIRWTVHRGILTFYFF